MTATSTGRLGTRRRRTGRLVDPCPSAPFRYDRPADVLAVLVHARAVVEAGWVQNRWVVDPIIQPAPSGAGASPTTTAEATPRACLVGAIALAVRDRDARADLTVTTGPALAAVWDAVQDDAAQNGAGGRVRPAPGRAAPPEVKVARMRELARWNDRPGRTRDEVVAVLDRATARVVAATVDPVRA